VRAHPLELVDQQDAQLLHVGLEGAHDGRVVEEGGRRLQPAVEVDDLNVGEGVAEGGDISEPVLHHGSHDAQRGHGEGCLVVVGGEDGCAQVAGHHLLEGGLGSHAEVDAGGAVEFVDLCELEKGAYGETGDFHVEADVLVEARVVDLADRKFVFKLKVIDGPIFLLQDKN